jgi:hypothetical protein
MKHFWLSLPILVLATIAASAQQPKEDYDLPELHTIKTVTLSPSYSCRSSEDFQRGYENTALFLSAYAKRYAGPDLLFNGACKSEDYFTAATAGDSFSLVADLGENVKLEDVSAARALNLKRVHSVDAYSKFASTVRVVVKHTYAVLLNDFNRRGLFIFTVDEYVPNEKVVLRYAVKSYQLPPRLVRSEGFDWERKNETVNGEK